MNTTELLAEGVCVCITPSGPSLAALDLDAIRSCIVERGGVVLKGFRMDVPAFEQFVKKIGDSPMIQAVGHLPSTASGVIQTVTPGSHTLLPHCENASTPTRPDLAFFLCERPADEGGESTVTAGALVARDLRAGPSDFAATRVRYNGVYHPDVWSRVLGTADVATAQVMLAGMKQRLAAASAITFDVVLRPNGVLRYDYITEPFVVCKRGEEVFADSYSGFATAPPSDDEMDGEALWVTLTDGEPYPDRFREAIHSALFAHARDVPLDAGDVLVVDNWSVLHGRREFAGPRLMHAAFAYASWLRPAERGPAPFGLTAAS